MDEVDEVDGVDEERSMVYRSMARISFRGSLVTGTTKQVAEKLFRSAF